MSNPNRYLLKLYITGKSSRSELCISNLKKICDGTLKDLYDLIIVDVLERPQLAEDAKILVTPTLIKEVPPPTCRIVGDMSDTEKVLLGLNLKHL